MGQIHGFSSVMKLIIFFIYAHSVYSELHTFMTIYTERSGQTAAGTQKFSALTTLEDKQTDYNDSKKKELDPRKKWMREFKFKHEEQWKDYCEYREKLQQIYKLNIYDLLKLFNHSPGLHTYQRMYGCEWDDETGKSQGFDRHNYNGENIITLDLKEFRYSAHVQQAEPIVQEWNNDSTQLKSLKQYFGYQFCVHWLKEFWHLSKASFEKADPPKVSLQQQEDYVECHVTGFLFRNTAISWRKNGQALSDYNKLETGETQPNEDGTFQNNLNLYVHPNEWKKEQYTCVVEHKSLTETIQKILTEDEVMRNRPGSDASYIMYLVPVIIAVIVGLIVLFGQWICKQRLTAPNKNKASSPGASLDPLISTN